jgi:hypothetical protein
MTHDAVNNPTHYNKNGIEVIDVIETYTPDSPHLANVLKYVCRHSYKGKPLEDLRKARWYLDRAIDIFEEDERAWIVEFPEEDEVTFDAYGRIVGNVPPVNIDGEFFIPEDDDEVDYSEPESVVDALYVRTPPDRIAGDDEAAQRIKNDYYNFNRNEVLDVCWNGCGETIERGDLYLTHSGKAFCSTKCVEDFKLWQKGER